MEEDLFGAFTVCFVAVVEDRFLVLLFVGDLDELIVDLAETVSLRLKITAKKCSNSENRAATTEALPSDCLNTVEHEEGA